MVTLTEGQKATLSSQAIEFLTNVRHVPFADMLANYFTSPCRIPNMREGMSEKMAPGEEALIMKHSLHIKNVKIAGIPVVLIQPDHIKPEKEDKILINAYGGAFVMGSARDRAALIMAAELGVRVYSVDYTKSPEAKYPVARDQVLDVYRELIKNGPPGSSSPIDPKNIYAMGSSAGAQLVVSALLMASKEGLPLPTAGIYLCTPAVDFTGGGDSLTANAHDRDVMPVSLLVGMVSQNYIPKGQDPKDPLLSPVYANYGASFPRTVITVGTRDFALSNGVRMYWKLRDAGVETELLVSDGMWHGFNWEEDMPEAIQARAAVVKFLEHAS
ncbi:hypothetical protein NQ176_g8172 [Zarea fungicola]|uniref:Uncharacterized protein n=1 Tax=Zarea fungicola TaxID=93591 RepID=A0ACC1MV11_9HYPO|nr:hypothetical protein NQ176_g8172 [Lecanicillium fungicola]